MHILDLEEFSSDQLIQIYSGIIKELKHRNIIRTNNVIGELGEFLAIRNNTPNLPNLSPSPIGTENIDAISRNGERYSIKSTSSSTTGVFYGLEPKGSMKEDKQKFEYVILCIFDEEYMLKEIYELDWETFLKNKRWHSRMNAWNLTVTKKLKAQGKRIF